VCARDAPITLSARHLVFYIEHARSKGLVFVRAVKSAEPPTVFRVQRVQHLRVFAAGAVPVSARFSELPLNALIVAAAVL